MPPTFFYWEGGRVKLEAVTAELRPRSDWEAVDLGLALVRRDFGSLGMIWWAGMLPAVLAGLWLLPDHPFWFCLLFWWWVPVASRLVLFKLSRRLFGDDPPLKEVLREFPRAIVRRFFHRMVLARLSPWRPLTMPVEELEGLKGADYRARCRVLMRRGDSSVIVLAMWRIFLCFWLAITLFCTAALFIPEGVGEVWSETISLWWDGESEDIPVGLGLAISLSLCVSLWLVDVFSIGAGFGIYVNHRTWIEGWDVELAFRRLGNRLRGLAGFVLAAGMLWLSPSVEAGEGKPVIDEVLAHEDFEVHRETIKTPKFDWLENLDWGGGGGSSTSGAMSVLEVLSVLLKVGLIGGGILFLGWLIYRYRHLFQSRGLGGRRKKKPQAQVVMGMAVAPESLPEDVADAALRMWREGHRQEAMSLLYRGAISWMINRGGVEIAESDTESDCLGRARQASVRHVDYFDTLTRQWIRLAYAREEPSDGTIEQLCGSWPFSERRAD